MAKRSAGLLMYRRRDNTVEVFLAHPGGPIWAKKDSWSIPKGEYEEDAKRPSPPPFAESLRKRPVLACRSLRSRRCWENHYAEKR